LGSKNADTILLVLRIRIGIAQRSVETEQEANAEAQESNHETSEMSVWLHDEADA